MWSDRHRWLKILVLLGVLALLGVRYVRYVAGIPVGWRSALEAPAQSDGQRLIFSLYEVTALNGEDPDRLWLSKAVKDVPVVGLEDLVAPPRDLALGDTVSVSGRFRAEDQVVVAQEVKVHRWRRAKQVASLVGLVGSLLWAPWLFGWRDGRVVLRG